MQQFSRKILDMKEKTMRRRENIGDGEKRMRMGIWARIYNGKRLERLVEGKFDGKSEGDDEGGS